MLDPSVLAALISTLRAGGVKRYRDGGLELELHTEVPKPPVSEQPAKEPTPAEVAESGLQMLLRSSGGPVPAVLKERLLKAVKE